MKYVLNSTEYVESIVIGAAEKSLIPNAVLDLDVEQIQVEVVGNGVLITVPDESAPKRGRRKQAAEASPPQQEAPAETTSAPNGATPTRRRRNGASSPASESDEGDVFSGKPEEA